MNPESIRRDVKQALDRALTRLLLAAIEEARERLGRPPNRTEAMRVLVGTKRRLGRERSGGPPETGPSPAESVRRLLGRVGATDVRDAIARLAALGLTEAAPGGPGRMDLTPQGREYLEGRTERPTGTLEALLAPSDPADAAFRALWEFRGRIAADEDLPASYVLAERTIRALAARRPRTLEELELVPGIGPAKIARYGRAILEVLGRVPVPRCSDKGGWEALGLADFGLQEAPDAVPCAGASAAGDPGVLWRGARPGWTGARR
jgi:hypothetical protein